MTNEKKPTIELGKQYQTRDGREAVADKSVAAREGYAQYLADDPLNKQPLGFDEWRRAVGR